MRFNISRFMHPRIHTLRGFDEVVESYRWGLTALGHQVTIKPNQMDLSAVNIVMGVFGVGVDLGDLDAWPANTVVCNFEQIAGADPQQLRPIYLEIARRFRFWDYAEENLATLRKMNPKLSPVLVPVGWAPTLRRIAARDKDIDVLIYGMPNESRLKAFAELSQNWVKSIFLCGLYDSARDELIARSKVILNLSRIAVTRTFEMVRVSYLLGNGKAVVSDYYPEYSIAADLREAIAFSQPGEVVSKCISLLKDDAERRRLETAGPHVMASRDIQFILKNALNQSRLTDQS